MNIEASGHRSRMRATLTALVALSLLATLVVADSANANQLSTKRAKAMANQLVKQQLRDRDRKLVDARISGPRRVNRQVIRFLYDDLSRKGVVCVGVIEIRRTGRSFAGRFRSTSCKRPDDEALAFRARARTAEKRLARKKRSMQRSIRQYNQGAKPCNNLNVPQERRDEASLLLTAGRAQATTRPLSGVLDAYAKSLGAVKATEPPLLAGAGAWDDYSDAVHALPKLAGGYCAALVAWSSNGYSDATAPVDFTALRATAQQLRTDRTQVRRAANHLRAEGIDPRTVTAFTLNNLIGKTAIN